MLSFQMLDFTFQIDTYVFFLYLYGVIINII